MNDTPPIPEEEQEAWDNDMWSADVEREQQRNVGKRMLLIWLALIALAAFVTLVVIGK
jgi:lipopolysaccharide/colanic/teichoic acid biosynthesis glycosyltransferase